MALKSMTAFGGGEAQGKEGRYRCEIRTLNSRYIDINIRLPRFLQALEPELINEIKEALQRGKVDVNFDVQTTDALRKLPKLNPAALEHYLHQAEEARKILKSKANSETFPLPNLANFLNWEGVLEASHATDPEAVLAGHRPAVLEALKAALAQVNKARVVEGEALDKAVRELIGTIKTHRLALVEQAETFQSQLYANYGRRLANLLEKVGEAGKQVEEHFGKDRLMAEVMILTEKTDIAEELTRLAIHEDEFLQQLRTGQDVGRKLDFLCQEMHREVNTMSNKLTAADASKHTLALKQTIERIRQQVQNIE